MRKRPCRAQQDLKITGQAFAFRILVSYQQALPHSVHIFERPADQNLQHRGGTCAERGLTHGPIPLGPDLDGGPSTRTFQFGADWVWVDHCDAAGKSAGRFWLAVTNLNGRLDPVAAQCGLDRFGDRAGGNAVEKVSQHSDYDGRGRNPKRSSRCGTMNRNLTTTWQLHAQGWELCAKYVS